MLIAPIQETQRQQVIIATEEYIKRANKIYSSKIEIIPVKFDLKGRISGMYKIKNQQAVIRYNPYLFAKYFEENLSITVPHEVAHYIVDIVYGMQNARSHGREWQEVMLFFGVEAKATGSYDLDGIPTRRYRKFNYVCNCRSYQLTSIRHNRIRRGAQYICRFCQSKLVISREALNFAN